MSVRVRTQLDARDAAKRIQKAIDEQASVEAMADARSRRQLAGKVSDGQVHLWLRDANWMTRRKSWDVEFRGALAGGGEGAILTGTIDIPDRRSLHRMAWLIRLTGGVIAITALGLALRAVAAGAPVDLALLIPLAVATIFFVGSVLMERDAERAAADDAQLLARFMRMTLGGDSFVDAETASDWRKRQADA